MDFLKSISIAASGLRAQAGRMRVISENIANADSTAQGPGMDPYRRKIPTFRSEIDRALMTDMREAQRSYEANVNVIGATRRMIQRTLEILKI
jgi:flagellar basal-body rod protein FlgC